MIKIRLNIKIHLLTKKFHENFLAKNLPKKYFKNQIFIDIIKINWLKKYLIISKTFFYQIFF